VTCRLTITVDADSEAKLRKKLVRSHAKSGSMPHVMADPVDAFFYDFGHDVLRYAERRSPVDTGRMKRSLRFRWGPGGAEVSARKPAAFVDYGTKPHWPPMKAIEGWAQRHGIPAFLVARKIAMKGTQSTKWFTGAVEDARKDLPRGMRRLVGQVETNWGK
jgi:hypothetical protein